MATVCHSRMAQRKFYENRKKSVVMATENVKITFMAITAVIIKIETSKLTYCLEKLMDRHILNELERDL